MLTERQVAITELEKAIKYRTREIESFTRKLELMEEQRKQYEEDLIPQYQKEIEQLKSCIQVLEWEEDLDLPF